MIIFSLEALADDSHRRHFIDPNKNKNYEYANFHAKNGKINYQQLAGWQHKKTGEKWKPDWQAYYDACDKDRSNDAVVEMWNNYEEEIACNRSHLQIWSTRCESTREKTIRWIEDNIFSDNKEWIDSILKMRPIGDKTPAHALKERWLKELWPKLEPATEEIKEYKRTDVYFVFESDPESIRMFRKHGIFVFDCNQKE